VGVSSLSLPTTSSTSPYWHLRLDFTRHIRSRLTSCGFRNLTEMGEPAVANAPPYPNIMQFNKGEAVMLIVGEEKHEMLVHANYLSSNSDFFKTALKKEWIEGQTRTITLPVDDPQTITHYLYFTYSGKLPSAHIATEAARKLAGTNTTDLARLYILGGRLLDDVIRKAVIEEFIRFAQATNSWPGWPAVSIIYDGTPEGDPARKLLVNMFANVAKSNWVSTKYDPVFLLELAQELLHKAEQGILPSFYRQQKLVASDYWT
jgi:hypothetical protein